MGVWEGAEVDGFVEGDGWSLMFEMRWDGRRWDDLFSLLFDGCRYSMVVFGQ